MSGGKSQTVGHRYSLGMHLVLCQGPIDEVSAIRVGDVNLPTDSVSATTKQPAAVALPATASQRLHCNSPDLFGGDDREGGVAGYMDLMMGEPSQAQNSYLVQHLGATISSFRGVVSLVLRQMLLTSNAPYLKPWAIFGKRVPAPALSAYGDISGEANASHIIYECLTSQQWGLGHPPADVDVPAFQAAAQQLHAEGFGISLLLSDQSEVESFMSEVARHVDATVFEHPTTGKWTIRLIRDDYTVGALPQFDESNILELDTFSRAGLGDLINQVTIRYTERASDTESAVTVHDIAMQEAQGGVVASTIDYPGIGSAALATQVATRELRALSAPLARVTLVVNRRGQAITPGAPLRFSWAALGISNMVLRCVRVAYGGLDDGRCRIEAIEDVFAHTAAMYAAPPGSLWTRPISNPAAAPYRLAFEAPYWLMAQRAADNDSYLSGIGALAGFLGLAVVRPASDAIDFELWTGVGAASPAYRDRQQFAPTATLATAIGLTNTVLDLDGQVDLDLVTAPGWAVIEDEWVAVVDVDFDADQVTVARGVIDTVPTAHAAGVRIWFVSAGYAADATEYADGETVSALALPSTLKGRLDIGAAPSDDLTMAHRFVRPYPPGKVRINTLDAPASIAGDMVLTWAHRDRTLQTAPDLVTQDAASIGPEAGTTYRLRIYNDVTDTLLRTETGLTGTTYTYTQATEAADNGGSPTTRTRIELEAQRDGYTSWQAQVRVFNRT